MNRRRPWRDRLNHERRVLFLALAGGLPAVVVLVILFVSERRTTVLPWVGGLAVLGLWLGFAIAVRRTVMRPLQTVSNLLAALREEDFSFRGRSSGNDALGQVMTEANALAGILREQRLGALEATALLRKVMEEIDVAVFTFDEERRLRLVNRAGERALGRAGENLLERTAEEIGLARALEGEEPRVLEMSFPSGPGRWEARVGTFRQHGLPHRLLVLANVSRALRDEERQAWQRLIRVLGHELNNSLTPIRSIAGSLEALTVREPLPGDWRDDVRRGLSVIASRAEALGRFIEAYGRLARLPAPQLRATEIGPLIRRVAGLETRLAVAVAEGPPVVLMADPDQVEQLLINLVRNGVDAALETGGGVAVGWGLVDSGGRHLEIRVDDEGPGLADTANLFVPFFTTKPTGSGVGLVLARQIAEAHGGSLTLENRPGNRGCRALLRLAS
jgi:nitrogen fixation/metabolism regulation signal transduction histidine kinase